MLTSEEAPFPGRLSPPDCVSVLSSQSIFDPVPLFSLCSSTSLPSEHVDVDFQRGVQEPPRLPRHWTSLVVEVQVKISSIESRKWSRLIDTGAIFFVVRPDVVPSCALQSACFLDLSRRPVENHFQMARKVF